MRSHAERAAAWEATANSYSESFGRAVPPTDMVEYPMQIMSLLSDAQEELHRWAGTEAIFETRANDNINAAKLMLSRMKDAAREAERNGS